MITIRREGTKLVVLVEHGLSIADVGPLKLEFETGREIFAEALVRQVQDFTETRYAEIRRLEYETGWKDGRKRGDKRRPKRTWFRHDLKRETT